MDASSVDPIEVVGQNIKNAREDAKLTQDQAAEAAGDMDVGQYRRLEAGKTNASVRTLVRVAGAFGVDPVALLEGVAGDPLERTRKGK